MILRFTLSEGKSYDETVFDLSAAKVMWANVLALGIFVEGENRFIAPWEIHEAVILDEPQELPKKRGRPRKIISESEIQ